MKPAHGPADPGSKKPASLPPKEQQFGAVAVRMGFITKERLNEALAIQQNLQAGGTLAVRLGELLVVRGWISPAQAAVVRKVQSSAEDVLEIPGYRLHEEIGRGQSGRVLRAVQVSMDRVVALKILHPRLAENADIVSKFVREARVVARLSHPNVVQGIDVGCAGSVNYFVMEFVEGPTLRGLLQPGRALDERYSLGIAIQIAKALQHAHENGLVHRDVKPGNILIARDGTAKLADLGLAVTDGSDVNGRLFGTPAYMSPEQVRGSADIDIRSDVYSLGATLFHLLTGGPPFTGDTVADVLKKHLHEAPALVNRMNPAVSFATTQAVACALQKDRAHRFATPADFAMVLERCVWELWHPQPAAAPIQPMPAPDARPRFAQRRPRRT
ncbi:MAG: serine/threonine protein kinase [Planctomycetota bacterium]|nr:MAG: serine/threonine protein kinase [Planctomycetota bacterium]